MGEGRKGRGTTEHTSVSVSGPTSNINNFVHKTRAEQTKNGWAGVVLGLHNKQTHRGALSPPLFLSLFLPFGTCCVSGTHQAGKRGTIPATFAC